MTVPGRRTRFGLVVAAAVCALSTGCTVGTAERAAAPDGPVAATDDVAADPVVAEPSAGDRTSEVTTIGPTTTTAGDTGTSSSTTTSTTEAPLTGWAATDDYLLRRIIGGGSTAASFAISVDGEIIHTAAMGERTLSGSEAATTTDRFRIASISKVITAITVLRLVEQGLVGLDEPVGARIAAELGVEAQPGAADITVRQLLTHTSGFGQNENVFFAGQVGSCRDAAAVGFSRSLAGTPGVGYRYSNMNFCVLGLLVESLTGEPYEQAVYEQLLTPLGISGMRLASTYDPGPDEIEHRTSIGRNYMESLGGAGAWVATPSDLVTILNSLDFTTPGWKPLSADTVAAMRTSAINPLVPDRGYGMGLILYGNGAFGHTGTVESTHAMVLDRGDGVTWAITVAGESPSESGDLAGIVDRALEAGGFVAGAPPEAD